MKTERLELDYKTAKYRIWNKKKKKWFYLVEKDSSLPFNQFLMEGKKGGDLYIATSVYSAPWLWGKMEKIK